MVLPVSFVLESFSNTKIQIQSHSWRSGMQAGLLSSSPQEGHSECGRVQSLTRVGLRACRAGAERSHRPFPQCGFRSGTQAQEPECRTWRGFGQLRCFWEGQQQCVAGTSTSRICLDWRCFGSCRRLFFACCLMHRWAVWAGWVEVGVGGISFCCCGHLLSKIQRTHACR